jgi:hypothetical protein
VPKIPARRVPVMMALAVLVGLGFASIPEPARAADGPVAVPVSPVDGGLFTEGDLEFVWSAQRGAADYELRTGLDGRVDGSGELVDAPSTTTLLTSAPSLAVSGLPEGTYYWQVRALDASGEAGPWSVVREVTVDLPGEGGGLQLETLALGDYAVEQARESPAVTSPDPGGVGMLAIVIASAFSVLLLSVVALRAAAVRVRT